MKLEAVIHRGKEWIALHFPYRKELMRAMRGVSQVKWSQDHRCWLLPLSRENFQRVVRACKGLAPVDYERLRHYLKLRKGQDQNPAGGQFLQVRALKNPAGDSGSKSSALPSMPGISEENVSVMYKMIELLTLKAYSPSTIKTYRNEVAAFLRTIGTTSAAGLNEEQIKRYLLYCFEKLGLSENTLHSRINALKFFYEQVLMRPRFFWDIPRPKRPLQLPKLLNEGELARLFNSLPNKKHKAMLFTAYSAGLRVSEVVKLKIADIDSERMQIRVARAKGKKDRYVNLSPVLLDILREYVKTYSPRPREYLFESEQTFTAYPIRTVQQIFSNAKAKAGIRKEVGVHSLRHSFATHLLDKGTDIRYIKDILGHFNIKTTERYLHVTKAKLVNIASPLDDLWRSHRIDW